MKKKRVTNSVEETLWVAREFSKQLKAGDIVALSGDLGSGKTTFIKGLALGLGLADPDLVKSPTFVLMHCYPTRIPLYHFDLYRLNTAEELQAIGFEDFLYDATAISCVEWADKATSYLPRTAYHLRCYVIDKGRRMIEFE